MAKKKVKVYPRMNPSPTADESAVDFERRNANVIQGSTVVSEVLQDSGGRLKSFVTTYEKPNEGFFSQFSLYLDNGRELQFVVNGPEQGPFESDEEANDAAVTMLADALMAAADQSDLAMSINPARRRRNPSDTIMVQEMINFNDDMTDLYEAAIVELGEKKVSDRNLDAIIDEMSRKVSHMLERASTPGFQRVAMDYRDLDSSGLMPEISIDSLASLKGNLATLRLKDFAKIPAKNRVADFTVVFMT